VRDAGEIERAVAALARSANGGSQQAEIEFSHTTPPRENLLAFWK
jgi:hypothetical protein